MKGDLNKLHFRTARKEDESNLVDLLMQPGVLPYFPMCDLREVEDAAKISISYIDQKAAYSVEYEGQFCGFMVLYLSPFSKNKHQALFMIIVSQEFRNLGIGTEMLRFLCQSAKEDHGIELLHLEVYEDNPARSLYEREGFVVYGSHPKFLKEPDGFRGKILMQKRL